MINAMKITHIVFLLLISMSIAAQEKTVEEGKGFNSVFQKVKSGEFDGNANGYIQIKDKNGKILMSSFIDEKSQLNIVPDKNKIYDVSFKNYIVENSNIKIRYTTYNYANVFKIIIPDGEYQLNLIDGSCEGIIKWLKFEYFETDKMELLILYFVKDVGLFPSKFRRGDPVVFVSAGSYLAFHIYKKDE